MSMTITPLEQGLQTAARRLEQVVAHFESVIDNMGTGLAGEASMTGPSAPNGPGAAPGNMTENANDLSAQDTQNLLNGDYFSSKPQDSKATCPSTISMDQLMNASGGLLKKTGNQTLKGDSVKGITGGITDNLARLAGGKPGDIGKDKNVTFRALIIDESAKNVPDSKGNMLPADVRYNGNLSGLNPSGEADNGSDVGYLQNMFKDSKCSLPAQRATSDHMKGNDTEKSGAEMGWEKVGKWIFLPLEIAAMAIPGVDVADGAALLGTAGADVAEGAATAANAGRAAASAGRAAAGAGRTAKEIGSSTGSSAAQDIMRQLALQTAKEGGKEVGNQIQNQLQQQSSPDGIAQGQTTAPYPVMVSA